MTTKQYNNLMDEKHTFQTSNIYTNPKQKQLIFTSKQKQASF